MQEIINYFSQVNHELPDYVWWLHLVAIASIIAISQGLKLPIKKFGTDKLAVVVEKLLIKKAEKKGKEVKFSLTAIRHKLNIIFIAFPFEIGILVSYIISVIAKQYAFSLEAGLVWGGAAGTIYETFARVIRRAKQGETITNELVKSDFVASEKETQKAQKEFLELVENAKKTK